jgi:hypothetical protein
MLIAPFKSRAADMWVNEIKYWQSIGQKRPELLKNPETCYAALVLKTALRTRLLSGKDSPQVLENEGYTEVLKKNDLDWMKEQRAAIVAKGAECLKKLADDETSILGVSSSDPSNNSFRQLMGKGMDNDLFSYAPAGYSLENFVGYEIGKGNVADEKGLDYKVFFEFDDYHKVMTAKALQDFAQALGSEDFRGDFKTSTFNALPGQNRFQYNNLIVHGHSIDDAGIAEQAGLKIFAGHITALSHGIDVMKKKDGTYIIPGLTQAYDWHHFLCTGNFDKLPAEVKAFVETAAQE